MLKMTIDSFNYLLKSMPVVLRNLKVAERVLASELDQLKQRERNLHLAKKMKEQNIEELKQILKSNKAEPYIDYKKNIKIDIEEEKEEVRAYEEYIKTTNRAIKEKATDFDEVNKLLKVLNKGFV